jgi:hypothetical protein
VEDNGQETRQERRDKKLQSKKERIKKSGKGLARVYKEAVLKRIRRLRNEKREGREI